MITITKIFEFSAGHHLPNYEGDCRNPHGHNYILEVTVGGEVDKEQGMIIDFKNLKNIVQDRVLNVLDHQVLNDHLRNPTAEHLVGFIQSRLLQYVDCVRIKLWETSDSYCEWTK
jgi:6-pyruvoyltetrahydropterin/6-carboxytetrahydropterin synthase